MARLLLTNTAVRLVVGPFVKISDFYSLYTSATVTNLAMNMWHEHDDGSAPTQTINAVAFTVAAGGTNDMIELAGGYYDIEITAAQTNFLGRAKFNIYDADQMLPYFEDWLVVPANIYNSVVAGTDVLDASLTQVNGAAQTATLDTISALITAEIADATSLTANSLRDRLRTLGWILRNKIEVTDANGNMVVYKDDSTTAAFTVTAALTDNSTTTTRVRIA